MPELSKTYVNEAIGNIENHIGSILDSKTGEKLTEDQAKALKSALLESKATKDEKVDSPLKFGAHVTPIIKLKKSDKTKVKELIAKVNAAIEDHSGNADKVTELKALKESIIKSYDEGIATFAMQRGDVYLPAYNGLGNQGGGGDKKDLGSLENAQREQREESWGFNLKYKEWTLKAIAYDGTFDKDGKPVKGGTIAHAYEGILDIEGLEQIVNFKIRSITNEEVKEEQIEEMLGKKSITGIQENGHIYYRLFTTTEFIAKNLDSLRDSVWRRLDKEKNDGITKRKKSENDSPKIQETLLSLAKIFGVTSKNKGTKIETPPSGIKIEKTTALASMHIKVIECLTNAKLTAQELQYIATAGELGDIVLGSKSEMTKKAEETISLNQIKNHGEKGKTTAQTVNNEASLLKANNPEKTAIVYHHEGDAQRSILEGQKTRLEESRKAAESKMGKHGGGTNPNVIKCSITRRASTSITSANADALRAIQQVK